MNKILNIITYFARWIKLSKYIFEVLMFVQKANENNVTLVDLISLLSTIKGMSNAICDIKYYSDKF